MPDVMLFRRILPIVILGGAQLAGAGCNRAATAAPEPSPRADEPIVQTDAGPAEREPAEPVKREPAQAAPRPGDDDRVIARVNGRAITMRQLQQPLVEAYGLNMLLNLVQLEAAKERAQRARITVTPQDIEAERTLTIDKLFPDADASEHALLLEQFLQQQRISEAEFDIVLEANAYLRKLAAPQVRGKISDENVREAFNQQYGETVQARHIQLANMHEVADAKRRLASGEPFEQVAEVLSRNPRTGPLGGELPPFSRASTGFPQAFRDAAFALKVGEVSDPVAADGAYHLIKLERRIEPKAVEFEKVSDGIRADLEDRLVQAAMGQLRGEISQEALKTLKIEEPTLRRQLEKRLETRESQVRDRSQLMEQFERQRERLRKQLEAEQAATQPATAPTTAPGADAGPTTRPAVPADVAPPDVPPTPPATAPATQP